MNDEPKDGGPLSDGGDRSGGARVGARVPGGRVHDARVGIVHTDEAAERGEDRRTAARPDQRVLILSPRGRNGPLIAGALNKAGMRTLLCRDADHLCEEMLQPSGAVVLCEEALNRERLACLVATIERQEPWSEIPLVVLTASGKTTRASYEIAHALGPRGNATLIERPVRVLMLVSAVRTALRSRRRQYEVRDLLTSEHAARAQAEAASNAKDHFLAALSHELRTPLNPVLMAATAMGADPQLPERYREDVDIIRRNVELESSLIDDLLDLTRITRGKLELRHEAVDLHALLGHAINTCTDSEATHKRLSIRIEGRAASRFVWGDAARLSQIFWNLLKNAIKFTPAGGSITLRTRNVEVGGGSKGSGFRVQEPWGGGQEANSGSTTDDRLLTPESRIVVDVTDTGIGIEPEAAARIFDAFEQENRGITRRFGGLGLGLAISKALVELHGGTIAVHSAGKGTGATFTVQLATIAEPVAVPAASVPSKSDARTGARILLVEDHEATAHVTARLLQALRYHVTTAPDVATAKRLAAEHHFDLIVSDIGLPDGTGLDLIRHIHDRNPVPALAVSGYGMEEDIRSSREAGFIEHLVKPVDLQKLRGAIDRVLAISARR